MSDYEIALEAALNSGTEGADTAAYADGFLAGWVASRIPRTVEVSA